MRDNPNNLARFAHLPPVVTPRDLADELRVGETIIGDMARRGDIPGAFRVGRLWRFHRDLALPHLAPLPDNVAPSWQDAAHQSRSATDNARATGPSGGANTDANANRAATRPRTRRRTTPTRSDSAFAKDFPEHARRGA